MTTETVLTESEVNRLQISRPSLVPLFEVVGFSELLYFARAIEQAVLQSEQVQVWKRDAEAYKWAIKNASWLRHEHVAYVAVPVHVDANLSCPAFRVDAIRAAMEQKT